MLVHFNITIFCSLPSLSNKGIFFQQFSPPLFSRRSRNKNLVIGFCSSFKHMKAIRIVSIGIVHRNMNCGYPAVGPETKRRRKETKPWILLQADYFPY